MDMSNNSTMDHMERRQKENSYKREFINWLLNLEDDAFFRQRDKIKIHITLTPENIAWQDIKNEWNFAAVKRGFDELLD